MGIHRCPVPHGAGVPSLTASCFLSSPLPGCGAAPLSGPPGSHRWTPLPGCGCPHFQGPEGKFRTEIVGIN